MTNSAQFSFWQTFLPLISVLTSFHDWGLVTRWALLLITSNYNLPSKSKDQSTKKAELTGVVVNREMRMESTEYGDSTQILGSFWCKLMAKMDRKDSVVEEKSRV